MQDRPLKQRATPTPGAGGRHGAAAAPSSSKRLRVRRQNDWVNVRGGAEHELCRRTLVLA